MQTDAASPSESSNIQSTGPHNPRLIKALYTGFVAASVISILVGLGSGGSGWSGGGDIGVLIDNYLEDFGQAPLDELYRNILSYGHGIVAVGAFSTFNMFNSKAYTDNWLKLLKEAKHEGFSKKIMREITVLTAAAVVGGATAIPSAIFTYNGQKQFPSAIAYIVAGLNFWGTGISSAAGFLGVREKAGAVVKNIKEKGLRCDCHTLKMAILGVFSMITAPVGLLGIAGNAVNSVSGLPLKIAVGACNVGPMSVFTVNCADTLDTLTSALSRSKKPEDADAHTALIKAEQIVTTSGSSWSWKKIVVPLIVAQVVGWAGAACLVSATGVLVQEQMEPGYARAILTSIVIALGFWGLFFAQSWGAGNILYGGQDWMLKRASCARKSDRVTELPA